jgi:serine kinase of HPr protein (carbohydrate metabolism regulator)
MASATGHHHASAVLVGEAGVLIRGASGAGKTQLALALIAEARRDGRFARLIGDDRIGISASGGRLVARPHPAIAGHVERRGLGLAPVAHEGAGIIRLVVDCRDTEPPRLPEPEEMVTQIEGVTLPRLGVMALDPQMAARLVMAGLALML